MNKIYEVVRITLTYTHTPLDTRSAWFLVGVGLGGEQ